MLFQELIYLNIIAPVWINIQLCRNNRKWLNASLPTRGCAGK